MFAEPQDFDRVALIDVVRSSWDISAASLEYQPVGFGTHHYLVSDEAGERWFVNVDDLVAKSWEPGDAAGALDRLRRSLTTAVVLSESGLEFVHPPTRATDGAVVVALGDRYAVSVFAFIDGSSNPWGEYPSDDERRLVLQALGRMHASTGRVPSDLPPRDHLGVPHRGSLFAVLEDLSTPWNSGPYADGARKILTEREAPLRAAFDRYDELADKVRRSAQPWVVTHGEPHAANVMRGRDGALHLIDWDTVALAPPERDLSRTGGGTAEDRAEDWAAYVASGGTPPDPDAIALFTMWWDLSEVAGYTETFRARHIGDENTRAAWKWFERYMP